MAEGALKLLRAESLQRLVAEHVGIALTRLGQLDDAFGEDGARPVAKLALEDDACHLEGQAHDALGFGVELLAVQEDRDRHDRHAGRTTRYIPPRWVCLFGSRRSAKIWDNAGGTFVLRPPAQGSRYESLDST
jgi:hypothetical protein